MLPNHVCYFHIQCVFNVYTEILNVVSLDLIAPPRLLVVGLLCTYTTKNMIEVLIVLK